MKTILVFAFIIPNLYLAFAEHPHYSYRCLENGDVELFGMHDKSAIQVDNSTCISKPNPTTKVHLINATCLKGKENATISVYDNVFDGVYQIPSTPHPTVAHNVVGGHGGHQFVITCKDIPIEGINKTVAHVFQGRVYNQLPDNYKEVASVEMRFKAVNDFSAPDISSVYIGDEFYMFIEYMGANKEYFVVPEECTAIGGTWFAKGRSTKDIDSVQLWNNRACAPQGTLLEKFTRENNTIIYAKMYGFRFEGHNFITITCQVKISKQHKEEGCMTPPTSPSTTTTTTSTTTTPSPTTQKIANHHTTTNSSMTGRRKRAIENALYQNKRLTKTLWVYDSRNVQLAENSSKKIKMEVPLWIVFIIVVTLRYY